MADSETLPGEFPGEIVCYSPTMIATNGLWSGSRPFEYALPIFVLQLTLVVTVTRLLFYILKPLKQPRVISEILGGIILGPSVLGRNHKFASTVFPLKSVMVLETMANVGLLYFLFLIGVEMDLSVVRRTGRKALAIAIAGMILPFMVGVGFSFLMDNRGLYKHIYVLFLGVALSVTAFPVLARILAELKLINTDIGRIAMSAALLNDMCAWILLCVAIALAENDKNSLASMGVIVSSVAFVLICFYVVRPLISWMMRRIPEGETISETFICLILTGVMISGFVTDMLGTHSVFGAFIFGLVIPNGPLGITLVEKLEDFVSGLLLPLYFASSGLRTNIGELGDASWGALFITIFLAVMGKIVGTLIVGMFYKMPIREAITLGLLMNTKGLVEMIILNVGMEQNVLDSASFSTMVVVAVIVTGIVTPIVTILYRPSKRLTSYKRRTVQQSRLDRPFGMVVCVHTPRNVPTILSLIESSNGTKRSPIYAYVIHLVELTGRASAMLIVHNARKSGGPAQNRVQAQSDHIVNAFENYEQTVEFVMIQTLTAISPYSTMHDDICNLAEEKQPLIIIIPFHKQQTVDGGMEVTNPALRAVNQNVLTNAPCSVGILVDRGMNGPTRTASNQVSHHIAVLFFGGPDDREALSYAWRMSEHQGVYITVMRFIPSDEATTPEASRAETINMNNITVITESERKNLLDEEYLNEFRASIGNDESIAYIEKVVEDGEETVSAIRSIESEHELFIVGRGEGTVSPLTAGLTDWSECPELGAIGDLLASADFGSSVSVLVIQQYSGFIHHGDGSSTPDSPKYSDHQPENMDMMHQRV